MLSLVLVLGWYVAASSGADEIEVRAEESARISKLIQQLGSALFDEREAAATELRQFGQTAVPQLTTALNHKSVEVRSRAAAILRQQLRIPLQAAIQKFAEQPEEKLDLEEGMWLISRILNPQVDKASLTRQLDDLAKAVRKKLGGADPKSIDPQRAVKALREVLFDDEKFGGNFADYSNPDNSSLEKVLASRKGLPILVSHVVIAVARRLDVPIVGLPTSGRYIVKYDGQRTPAGFPKEDIVFDPFDNGKVLTREDRMELFPGADPDNLAKLATRREALIRMLNNLESHLFQRDETDLAYVAVEFRVALQDHMTEK
ncbi:MAG: transglutaminase-like domain-containing protein [Planctomycetota bacterium]